MEGNMTDLGTIYKLNIHIEGLPTNMDDVDFSARFYCFKDSIEIPKKDMIRIDENNYVAVVDSNKIGRGEIKMQITVQILDADIEDGIRTEVYTLNTNITIK